jgi:hypothetical protein
MSCQQLISHSARFACSAFSKNFVVWEPPIDSSDDNKQMTPLADMKTSQN